ncbi:hypothetical protein B0H13DRAFT_1934068 [Mycena leptocephala]|nr:hypothetical protein B0H13DRAFT_1934068 [Mycena leptocephala]
MSAFNSGSQSNGEQMRTTRYQASYPNDETLWSGPESNGDVSAAKLIYPIQHEVQMRTTRYQAPYLDNLVLCLMGLKSSLEPILETSQLHVPRVERGVCDAHHALPGLVPQHFGAVSYGLEILILEPILETSQLHVIFFWDFKAMGADVRHALPGLEQYSLAPRDGADARRAQPGLEHRDLTPGMWVK